MDNPEREKIVYASQLGGAIGTRKSEFASLCMQCRQCVEQCPQHVDIPAVLESVVAELEGPGFEERVAMTRKMPGGPGNGVYPPSP